MHVENCRGNFIVDGMVTQTVALLHGLKAVYAPIPIVFNREWDGRTLDKYFNPGPKGESGSTKESPFSSGKEEQFDGSTLGHGATPPTRLYRNWLGWKDFGIGGVEVRSFRFVTDWFSDYKAVGEDSWQGLPTTIIVASYQRCDQNTPRSTSMSEIS